MDFLINYYYNMYLAIPNKEDPFEFPVWDLYPKIYQVSFENSRNNQVKLKWVSGSLEKCQTCRVNKDPVVCVANSLLLPVNNSLPSK